MTWVAAADFHRAKDDSLRSHPCLVYSKVAHLGDKVMIGAVASGFPQAKLSHVGARLAVRAALGHLRSESASSVDSASDATGEHARMLYLATVSAVRNELRNAVVDQVVPLREFATALSVFIATPTGVAAMQIGSGLLVTRRHSGDYSVLFSEGAEIDNGRIGFVTDEVPAGQMRISVQEGPVAFLCAASTPLERLSIRRRDGVPQKAFFAPLDRYTSTAPDDGEVHRGIRTFLRSDRVHSRLDQDIALALCGYRRQGELFGASAA